MENQKRPKPRILKEAWYEDTIFTLPGLPFWHRLLIKISCFFRNGLWTSFFVVFSGIVPENCDFETPAGPSWGPKWFPKSFLGASFSVQNAGTGYAPPCRKPLGCRSGAPKSRKRTPNTLKAPFLSIRCPFLSLVARFSPVLGWMFHDFNDFLNDVWNSGAHIQPGKQRTIFLGPWPDGLRLCHSTLLAIFVSCNRSYL